MQTNLVVTAYDAGVLEAINNEYELDLSFIKEHTNKLINDYGITKDNANWVINTLCKVYGGNILYLDLLYIDNEDEIDTDVDDFGLSDNELIDEDMIDFYYTNKNKVSINKGVHLSNMKDGEKLPKSIIQRLQSEEEKFGIDDITYTVVADGELWGEDSFKVTGEVLSNSLSDDFIMFIMAYNSNNELIGCSFDHKIYKDDCNGFTSFSINVYIPKNETISKILIRPSKNPAGWW